MQSIILCCAEPAGEDQWFEGKVFITQCPRGACLLWGKTAVAPAVTVVSVVLQLRAFSKIETGVCRQAKGTDGHLKAQSPEPGAPNSPHF